jgi:putative membrane protein
MRGLIIRWFVTAVGLWVTSELFSGIRADGMASLLFAAIVLGVFNAILRPIILLLTLPINLLTLGLFTFVINGFMLKLTGAVVGGFSVEGFWTAVGGAILLSVVSFILNVFINDEGRVEYIYIEHPPRRF